MHLKPQYVYSLLMFKTPFHFSFRDWHTYFKTQLHVLVLNSILLLEIRFPSEDPYLRVPVGMLSASLNFFDQRFCKEAPFSYFHTILRHYFDRQFAEMEGVQKLCQSISGCRWGNRERGRKVLPKHKNLLAAQKNGDKEVLQDLIAVGRPLVTAFNKKPLGMLKGF